ncbi:MAG: PEGA domain-containing protein, partial [Spongiibacteraceae bacterium]|nr:PEGA domain-containing protein [Spongiibacteraceae bacterium]
MTLLEARHVAEENTSIKKQRIHPLDYSPAGAGSPRWHWRVKPITVCLGIALIIIGWAATFVFSAHSLVIQTTPAFAEVDIRGGFSLPLGSRYLLRAGDYTMIISAPGYHPLTQVLTVTDKQNQSVALVLEKMPGFLLLDTTPAQGITFVVDGNEQTPTVENTLELTAGEHHIRISAKRYLTHEQVINIDGKGKQQTLSVSLNAAWATFNVSSIPNQVQLYVDGEFIGLTPLQSKILQGEHALVFELDGYESHQ